MATSGRGPRCSCQPSSLQTCRMASMPRGSCCSSLPRSSSCSCEGSYKRAVPGWGLGTRLGAEQHLAKQQGLAVAGLGKPAALRRLAQGPFSPAEPSRAKSKVHKPWAMCPLWSHTHLQQAVLGLPPQNLHHDGRTPVMLQPCHQGAQVWLQQRASCHRGHDAPVAAAGDQQLRVHGAEMQVADSTCVRPVKWCRGFSGRYLAGVRGGHAAAVPTS